MEASAEKKRTASEAGVTNEDSKDEAEKSAASRRSATPEPAKKKKKIDPVRLYFL